ncbi:MAG: arylsulfatase [Kiritimatiellae bacterium]|nr:arylsulfatase [Kiritimatiellia bacterium]
MKHAQRPNILLILNDDMGYSDLGCYGGEIDTPNLNRLAEGGLRFTQFYNTARCCPSRASLLTGLHPHQTGIGGMVGGGGGPEGYEGTINDRCVTIAEALRAEGYATAMSGKWHLAGDHENENKCWPTSRGFDHHYGIITGAADYYAPRTLKRNGRDVEHEAQEDPEYYFTDAISDDAVDCINRHFTEPDPSPLFQYVAYTAPHWPLHAREEDIARYKGRFSEGWDSLREARMKRMVELGVVDPKWALSARDESQPAWDEAEDKEWQQRRMEVYAAQIDVMDQGIGRITAALEAQGQLDNTLILFLADNGGACEEVSIDWVKQGWMDELSIIQHETKEGKPVRFGNTPDIQPGEQDTYCSYGVPWANLSNTPFRLYKCWIHEGGISTPFIAHWPAGMQAQPGSLHHSPWHLPDVMATLLDVAGAPYPVDYAGRDVKPPEGHSFAAVLNGQEAKRPAPLFWEHEGNAAVRDGRWKLVRNYQRDSSLLMTDPAAWELYDINEDRTELHDLSAQAPDRVRKMLDAFLSWAKRCSVLDVHELRK